MAEPVGRIKVEGARELRATLKRAGDDLQDLRTAHAGAAGIVVPAAKSRTPVQSGKLQASVRGSGSKTQAVIRAGFASVPYAGVIHWGWPAHGIEAHPFLSEGAQATEHLWSAEYEAAVNRVLSRIKGV